ncbi:MAG: YdeI/OmpD-associated family protein [Bacteroidota bacterium]
MSKQAPLVDDIYLLEKFPGKGGWIYATIPEIAQNPEAPFGWVKVKGSIDGYPLKQYKLMPMGNGQLFLPVKAAIRKQIKKEAGDWVHIVLSLDDSKLEIPQEIIDCFQQEPTEVHEAFKALNEGQQKTYLDWIYAAKREETKAQRIVEMMDQLAKRV